jgi:serine/threonine-protein kinase
VQERANSHPSGSASSAIGHRFGTHELRELLAVRGDAGLWIAEDDDGSQTLVRLYPGLPTLDEWHTLELAASQLMYAVDPRLVPIKEIALDVWPHLSFACSGVESLARRIARGPMAPEEAVAMCADVTAALAALGRAGVPPVDIGPADVVLARDQARLLADVGLPGGKVAQACIDLDHVAPERVAAIADRAQGLPATRPGAAAPTAESMTYALASIVSVAIHGPRPVGVGPDGEPVGATPLPTPLPPQLQQVLRRGLAQSPSERYRTPAALVAALVEAIGVPLWHLGATNAARAPRVRSARAATARRRAKPRRRRLRIAIPAAVLLVAAAAAGTIAGSASTSPDPPAAVTLSGAGLSVQAPQGWLRGTAAQAPPAIGAPALVVHAPGRSSDTALVITRAATPLLAQLADVAPKPVRLGDQDAWHYSDVALDADSVADVYVLEDGDQPIVAACLGPSDAPASVRAGCSAALTTLHLQDGQVAALGGGAAARRELARVVAELDRTRESARRALATAATGRGQAAAADRLTAAYARAASDAKQTGTVGAPGDLPRLVDRLETTGRAYGALATAARTRRRPAYAQARERIAAQERALQDALAALAPTSTS